MSKEPSMNTKSSREILVNALAGRLLPFLQSKGFVERKVKNEKKSREFDIAFPLGHLKREMLSAVQIIEIQFDKRGGAKFVINFGILPKNGVRLPWGNFTPEELTASSLEESYRLMRFPSFHIWFGLGFIDIDKQNSAIRLADEMVSIFSEVEAWFETGVIGKHMRRLGYPH